MSAENPQSEVSCPTSPTPPTTVVIIPNGCEACEVALKNAQDPEKTPEVYSWSWGRFSVSVDKAKACITPDRVQEQNIVLLAPFVTWPEPKGQMLMDLTTTCINYGHVDHVPLDQPIIIMPPIRNMKRGMVIDGHHRICKGLKLKREMLPVFILTEREAEQCFL